MSKQKCIYCGQQSEEMKEVRPGQVVPICDSCFNDFHNRPTIKTAVGDYQILADVLNQALQRASLGKGYDRHGSDEPFEKQQGFKIAQLLGSPDSFDYQIIKKVLEGNRLHRRLRSLDAKLEWLDAIVFIAMKIIEVERYSDGG